MVNSSRPGQAPLRIVVVNTVIHEEAEREALAGQVRRGQALRIGLLESG